MSSAESDGWSSAAKAAAVVGTSIEMSRRTAGEWNSCVSDCCEVGFDAVGALNNWQCVEMDMVGKELVL